MDAIQLGPLLLKKSYIVLLFSCLLAYLYIAVFLRKRKDILKAVEQHLLSTLILWIIVFKFSIVLFRPSIIWTNPYGIIFFNGGTKGVYLATILAFLFIYWQSYKSKIDIKTITAIVVPSFAIVLLFYWGLTNFL